MQNVDRYTKVMLTLLVLGVWAMLLRPLFHPTVAQAQQATFTGVYAEEEYGKGETKIAVWPNDTLKGRLSYVLSANQMSRAVMDANARGWKIKAVTAAAFNNPVAGETVGYTIFVEK